MRISDWSSDVCSSDLRDISFHPWRKPCSRLIDHGQIEGRRRAAHRPSPGHARPIGAQKNRFGLAIAVVDIKTRSGLPKIDHLGRSGEHTSELQSLMRISYAVFCLKKKKQ